MHLWPSSRIRDSFKRSYIEKLEWNLHLMKRSQASNSDKTAQDPLLPSQHKEAEKTSKLSGLLVFCQELLFLFSCCYCCGACDDEEEK